MSGFGDQPVHGTYDEIADELRSGAKRLALPLAAAVRRRALGIERDAEANRRNAQGELTRAGEAELLRRRMNARIRNPQRNR